MQESDEKNTGHAPLSESELLQKAFDKCGITIMESLNNEVTYCIAEELGMMNWGIDEDQVRDAEEKFYILIREIVECGIEQVSKKRNLTITNEYSERYGSTK